MDSFAVRKCGKNARAPWDITGIAVSILCRRMYRVCTQKKITGGDNDTVLDIFTRSRVWTNQTFLFSCSQHGTTFSKYPNNATHV